MDKVTYFDVEYANSKNKSICQIGLRCVDYNCGEPIYPDINICINPEDGFDENCMRVHGITQSMVADKPTFPQIWGSIEPYFTNATVVGHNVAGADLDALVKNLYRYSLDIPQLYYICVYELARKYVPSFSVENYSMPTLCRHFGVELMKAHDAYSDAIACGELFNKLVDIYDIDADAHTKKYTPLFSGEYSAYISDSTLRRAVSEFYGIIRGFSIDNTINEQESAYIESWRNEHLKYSNYTQIDTILCIIDEVLNDGIVTTDEMAVLEGAVESYLNTVSTSSVTLATQVLDGILKGITIDGEITEDECKNLRTWLYDNIHLADHFPFDRTIETVDTILADSVLTKDEADYLNKFIRDMLNPVEHLKGLVNSVYGKHVCLSGNFSYGAKADVEKYITAHGGIIDTAVKKGTDILMVGNLECMAYSNGTYGSKVKKALEYNTKGSKIAIIKESDYFFDGSDSDGVAY